MVTLFDLDAQSAVVVAMFHASWNLAAAVYVLAATDLLVTLPLGCVTALVLYLEKLQTTPRKVILCILYN
jgi:hypothetical protein